jgi:hypothetical protein
MYCHKCGVNLLNDSQFCHVCGAALTQPIPVKTSSPTISPIKQTKLDLGSFKKVEEATCIHCGYTGVHGVNKEVKESARTTAFTIAGIAIVIGALIASTGYNPQKEGTSSYFVVLGFLIINAIRYSYTDGKLDVFHCPSCNNKFYKNNKGEISKGV